MPGPRPTAKCGTLAGYNRHCREGTPKCAPCREAMRLRQKAYRDSLPRGTLKVDAWPIIRRLQALHRLGWNMQDIYDVIGKKTRRRRLSVIMSHPMMLKRSANEFKRAYKLLHMKAPDNIHRGRARVRNHAIREGWAPPLAWDDIDDPNEVPSGIAPDKPSR